MTTTDSHPSEQSTRGAPSGRQFAIRSGDQHATVTEIGAAIREYRVGERAVFVSYPRDEFSDAFHGAVLLPWPNRIRDGKYRFDGVDYQLALTEPARMTALHGLSPWRPWSVIEHESDRVSLRLQLLPSPGYPFHLDAVVEYRLSPQGLVVTAESTNVGTTPLPYGIGFHPYLSGGGARVDDCVLRVDAGRRVVSDERLLPSGIEDVTGTAFDFRMPREIGSLRMDDAFTEVARDDEGRGWVSLTAPDGRTAAIWSDHTCAYWQVFTSDTLSEAFRRRGLAAEPMTAAPDAFNSGAGMIVLAPGESSSTTWGARLT